MAQPTNTYDTYDLKGEREDLSDLISDISPMDTPGYTMFGRESTHNVYFEWQNDALRAAAQNAHIQGDDTTSVAPTATTRIGNYTQISKEGVTVSGTARAIDTAGRADEFGYQIAKSGKQIKRDIENDIWANNGAVAGNSSTASETAGFGAFLKTNVSFNSGGSPAGANPSWTTTPTAARTDSGTARAYTETLLKATAKLGWDNGAEPEYLMLGSFNKQAASAFTGIAANRFQVPGAVPGTVIGAVDVYVSDFGELKIMANRFQRAQDAWHVDMSKVRIRELRPMQYEDLAKTGDSDKGHLVCEWGLQVDNEKAHCLTADLTTS